MEKCPCGSGLLLKECCEPYIRNTKEAETPEKLMRARYTAFVKSEIDFIMDTVLASKKHEFNRKHIEKWAEESIWYGLDIVKTDKGAALDSEGNVEFKATYSQNGMKVTHHENASFKKEDGKWFLEDGEMVTTGQIVNEEKIGRNDPCPCGSGKKFKKCCGSKL